MRVIKLTLLLFTVMVSLIPACTPNDDGFTPTQRTTARAIETTLRRYIGAEYDILLSPGEGDAVNINVQWHAEHGPGSSGLELMVPEEADHAILNMLRQSLPAEHLAHVGRIYFQRIELED